MHQLHQNVGEDNLGTVTKLENLTLHQLHQNMGEDDLAKVTKIQSVTVFSTWLTLFELPPFTCDDFRSLCDAIRSLYVIMNLLIIRPHKVNFLFLVSVLVNFSELLDLCNEM